MADRIYFEEINIKEEYIPEENDDIDFLDYDFPEILSVAEINYAYLAFFDKNLFFYDNDELGYVDPRKLDAEDKYIVLLSTNLELEWKKFVIWEIPIYEQFENFMYKLVNIKASEFYDDASDADLSEKYDVVEFQKIESNFLNIWFYSNIFIDSNHNDDMLLKDLDIFFSNNKNFFKKHFLFILWFFIGIIHFFVVIFVWIWVFDYQERVRPKRKR